MKKRIKDILLLVTTVIFTSGCVLNTGTRIYDNDKMIVKDYDSYNLVQSKHYVENNRMFGSADTMEGTRTIWMLDASEATDVEISYKLKISSGKAKLVLISPDNTVTNLIECEPESDFEEETSSIFPVEVGENRMKLVAGKDTKIEFEVFADKGEIKNFNN